MANTTVFKEGDRIISEFNDFVAIAHLNGLVEIYEARTMKKTGEVDVGSIPPSHMQLCAGGKTVVYLTEAKRTPGNLCGLTAMRIDVASKKHEEIGTFCINICNDKGESNGCWLLALVHTFEYVAVSPNGCWLLAVLNNYLIKFDLTMCSGNKVSFVEKPDLSDKSMQLYNLRIGDNGAVY